MWRLHAVVDMLSVVTIRPAVESPVLYGRHIIWDKIAADFIAHINRRPQCSRLRVPSQAHWISQPRGKHAMRSCPRADSRDAGAAPPRPDPILAGIAFRADCHIKATSV